MADGQRGFCFGAEKESWQPYDPKSLPLETATGEARGPLQLRHAFYEGCAWEDLQTLLLDARLLRMTADGAVAIDAEMTGSMLALTAVHGLLKIAPLQPFVLPEHAPYNGVAAGSPITNPSLALAYLLEYDHAALPCLEMLPATQWSRLRFTQERLGFNHSWLVQAEAPPAALFARFKERVRFNGVGPDSISFYFVHWLTALAGATPTPLNGCEKLVLGTPHSVLAGFIHSFHCVRRLKDQSPTQVTEDFLVTRWVRHPSEVEPRIIDLPDLRSVYSSDPVSAHVAAHAVGRGADRQQRHRAHAARPARSVDARTTRAPGGVPQPPTKRSRDAGSRVGTHRLWRRVCAIGSQRRAGAPPLLRACLPASVSGRITARAHNAS